MFNNTVINVKSVCGEFEIELSDGKIIYVSPDGISVHPDKDNLKDCMEGRDRMRNYFYFKSKALVVYDQLIDRLDLFPNTKNEIENYAKSWRLCCLHSFTV